MEKSSRPVAFITGASSGIGEGVALDLAKKGYRLALFARRKDRLEKVKATIVESGSDALILEGDVTSKEMLDAAVTKTLQTWGRIDLVLANAGFVVTGTLSKLTIEDYRRQFETNVFGVLNTIYATREAVIETRGILAITGSIAGQMPIPFNSPYSMSKFAVRALAHSLRIEMKRRGVAVVLISPGFIGTELTRVDNLGQIQEKVVKQVPASLTVTIDKAAPQITRAILSRKAEVVITGHGKAMVWANKHFPELTQKFILKML